ncbi:helix-turn-helix transcriptional regulator [Hymenobacter bucti]|uniref:Helix-turn-helix transcriptional regulator n=1 Tax=Hymenobacter bucti TaxID=1844114 RepID=A0ABW4QXC1_9BACT
MAAPLTYPNTAELYGRPALEASLAPAGPALRVERYQLDATALPAHAHADHLLLLHQGAQPVVSRRRSGSRVEEDLFHYGDGGLYPAGEYGPLAWDGPADVLHLHLNPQLLEDRARQGLDLTHFALRDQFRLEDGLLTHLGRQLLTATGAEHALGQLYTESLTTALSLHLITHYASYEQRIANAGARLPGAVLARIEAYIEAAAEQVITLEALAELANLSVFHFARRFKLTIGRSPYQYVLDWKITRARQLLRAGNQPVAVISDTLGFASPAHFSAAFKRAVGQSPRTFQRG